MDYVIIAVVSLLGLAVHVALYFWVRFKIDEAVITKYLESHGATSLSTAAITTSVCRASDIRPDRCKLVVNSSVRLRYTAAGDRLFVASDFDA